MLSDIMEHYGLVREFSNAGYFDTEHHQQIFRELKAAIRSGRLVALTGIVGTGKTTILKRIQKELKQEREILVSKSLSVDKARINLVTLITALLLASIAGVQAQTLKIASIAPEGSVWMVEMRKAAEEIDQRTEGRVKFRFYGGGVQGNDSQVMRKMRIGQLHGATFSAGELGDFAREAEVYSLPMTFDSNEEVLYVRNRMDERLRQALEDAGKVNFGFAGGGFGYMLSNAPIASLEDMKRLPILN